MHPRLFRFLSLAAAGAAAGSAATFAWTAAIQASAAPVFAAALPGTPAIPGFALIELFTSEGCSSCPPADRLLADLAAEAEREGRPVYALSFHVDYWNHLGWADPFSRPEFSDRQRRYADALGGGVYTPEMVVNGAEAFVGSKGSAARSAVRAALGRSAPAFLRVDSAAADGHGNVRVTYAVSGRAAGSLLNLALVEEDASVPVARGENGGRTLKHRNVVRAFRTIRNGSGQGSALVPIGAGLVPAKLKLIAWLQDPETLAVTAAARSDVGG